MGLPLHLDVAKRQGSVSRLIGTSIRCSPAQAVFPEELPS